MTNIFIANLDWGITSDDLKTTFSAFGPVHYAHVVFDKETKKSKGYGYVEMEDTDDAINAIKALNGLEVNDRKLDVKIASPKENRPPRKETVEKPYAKKNTGSRPQDLRRTDNRSARPNSGSNDQRGGYVKRDNKNND